MLLLTVFRSLLSLVAICTAAVLFAAAIQLDLPGFAALSSLRFHLTVLALCVPLLLLLLGARWRAAIMLLVIVLSLAGGIVTLLGQQSRRASAQPGASAATFFSFNVGENSERGGDTVDLILAANADLALIIEPLGISRALGRLSAVYPYRLGCETDQTCRLALFSKTPLLETAIKGLGPLNQPRLLTAQTGVAGTPVTIVALQLSDLDLRGTAEQELADATKILRATEGPLILAGDFSLAIWSEQVDRFMQQLGLAPPPDYPATFPARAGWAGLPTDTVLAGGGAVVQTIDVAPAVGSSHLRVLATIALPASP